MSVYPDTHGGFFQAGGALSPGSPSYIEREADEVLTEAALAGEYCNVLAARQMGKSSLLARTAQELNVQGRHTLYVDLTAIGGLEITPEQWYYSLVSIFCRGLNLDLDERDWWKKRHRLGTIQRFTDFLQQIVLKQLQGPIVVFIDEIDSTLTLPFTDDFFALIRAMYNQRSTNEENKRLTFVLAGVARPADLIKDTRSTPYNIGTSIDLADFSVEDAKVLLRGLESRHSADQSKRLLDRILHWTGGHPYLTQKLCAEVVRLGHGTWSNKQVDALVEQLFFQEDRIRQDLNLQWIDAYVYSSDHSEELMDVYGQIGSGKSVPDDDRSLAKSRLKLSGLVKVTSAGQLQVRNRIYERVFGPEWAGISTSYKRRSRTAFFLMPTVLLVAALSISAYWMIARPFRATPTATLITAVSKTITVYSHTPEPTPSPALKSTATETVIVPTATEAAPTTTFTATRAMPTATPTITQAVPTGTLTITRAVPTGSLTITRAVPTATPTPTMVPIIPMSGTARAVQWANIFAYPNQSPHDVGIQTGQSVRLLGQAAAPWSNWLYVYREQDGAEGFVWKPGFEIYEGTPLRMISAASSPLCVIDQKMLGLEVQLEGGDNDYVFYWEEQMADAVNEMEDKRYLVSWIWGKVPQVGKLLVVSGDGQTVSSPSIFVPEPSCP